MYRNLDWYYEETTGEIVFSEKSEHVRVVEADDHLRGARSLAIPVEHVLLAVREVLIGYCRGDMISVQAAEELAKECVDLQMPADVVAGCGGATAEHLPLPVVG